MKRIGALVVLAMAGIGCGTVRAPGMPVPTPAMTVQASFSKTWDAVIDEFSTLNIPIRTVDRSSGLIATEQLSVSPYVGDVADCGSDWVGPTLVPTNAIYNVVVRGDSVTSTVRVNVRWIRVGMARGLGTNTVTEDCATEGNWETGFELGIKAAAEGKH